VAEGLAEVLGDDGGALGGAGVVARVREAGEPLEEDLELEEDFVLLVEREAREPRLARLRVLAPQAARVAEQIGVRIALQGERLQAHRPVEGRGHGGEDSR
jgi:hypothetical protein